MLTQEIIDEILEEGATDWISLDDIAYIFNPEVLGPDSKEIAADGLSEAFRAGLLIPGDLLEPGFVDWSGGPDEWDERVRVDIHQVDWPPMGDGFWLRLDD